MYRSRPASIVLVLTMLASAVYATIPGAVFATTGSIGNDAIDRSVVDTFTNFTIVDTNNNAPFDGTFEEVTFYAKATGTINFVVVEDTTLEVTYVSEDISVTALGAQTVTLATPATVTSGDHLGYYTHGAGVIPFSLGGTQFLFEPNNSGKPAVGDPFNNVSSPSLRRIYSMNAEVLVADPDTDGDGVVDSLDVCPGTVIPDPDIPTNDELGTNRWALVDGDGDFDTTHPKNKPPKRSYTIDDTAGCNAGQIADARGLGEGHYKHGLSNSAMDEWVALVNP